MLNFVYHSKHIKIISTVTIILLLIFLFLVKYEKLPNFSNTDWIVEIFIDSKQDGIHIYYKTDKQYAPGDLLTGYSIIYLKSQSKNLYEIKNIHITQAKRDYVEIYIPDDNVNLSCFEIVDSEGNVVKSDTSVIVEWPDTFPTMDWGYECDKTDWKYEYLKVISNKQQSRI